MNLTSQTTNNASEAGSAIDESVGDGVASTVSAGSRQRHASRGQILILAAAALVGLIGLVGLATDLGYSFAERRTMQNAADAGALAGAHAIAQSDPSNPSIVLGQVEQAAWSNTLNSTHPTVTSCMYVDNNDAELGPCSAQVPDTASGVKVFVKETHNTFFIGVIPGAPKSLSTRAMAIAHVQYLKSPPGDGPFIVCGVDTKVDSGGGNTMNIVVQQPDGSWAINPNAVTTSSHIGPKFQVFGPNISTCGLTPQNFKGQAVGTDNENLRTPDWFYYQNGDAAGHVDVSVTGVNGCTPAKVINCVAFLPVAVDNPAPNTTTLQMWSVMVLPFYLTPVSYSNGNLNKIDGQLLGDYITQGEGKPTWIPGGPDVPIVIHLTK